jgi:glycosyltransferase involved in cell wall biosynthesis
VFVTASRAEVPDYAGLEAMAFGLPVIAARGRGLLERVDASCGVLVEPGDTEHLVASILALQRDTAPAAALGAAGRARAARFAPEPLTTEWEGVYETVLARHQERVMASHPAPQPTAPRS